MSEVIVVKIGTDSLGDFQTSEKVNILVQAIAEKTKQWIRILLVTSWAVQFGRNKERPKVQDRQVLAAKWWHKLLVEYGNKFEKYGLEIAGFLAQHADIEDDSKRGSDFIRTIEKTWDVWDIPIVNENDPMSTEEMREVGRWADNDKNAFFLARLFQATQLIIITNTNGVYLNRDDPNTRVSSFQNDELTPYRIGQICNWKSQGWTGWMESKLSIAYDAWFLGMDTHIGNGIDSGLHDTYAGGTNIWHLSQFPDFQN
jgi:glutamate 5-kinase